MHVGCTFFSPEFQAGRGRYSQRAVKYADLEAHPEFTSFAVSTSRKSKKAAAASDDLHRFWS
jgi:hypothetical protein